MMAPMARRLLIPDWRKAHTWWSVWVAAFWGGIGAVIVILSALLYQHFDWRVGVLLIAVSATFAIARVLKQPGAD